MPARMEARFHQINCDLSHFFLAILSLYLTILHFSSLNYEVISQFVLFSLLQDKKSGLREKNCEFISCSSDFFSQDYEK